MVQQLKKQLCNIYADIKTSAPNSWFYSKQHHHYKGNIFQVEFIPSEREARALAWKSPINMATYSILRIGMHVPLDTDVSKNIWFFIHLVFYALLSLPLHPRAYYMHYAFQACLCPIYRHEHWSSLQKCDDVFQRTIW